MTVPLPKFLPPGEDTPQAVEQRTDPVAVATAVGVRAVKQIIVIRKDLHMQRGKEIAQGAHAAMAWLSRRLIHSETSAIARFTAPERQWLLGDFRKVTLQVSSLEELTEVFDKAVAAGLEVHMITDSGHTVFHGTRTKTCLAIGPDYEDRIDPITENLKLY